MGLNWEVSSATEATGVFFSKLDERLLQGCQPGFDVILKDLQLLCRARVETQNTNQEATTVVEEGEMTGHIRDVLNVAPKFVDGLDGEV